MDTARLRASIEKLAREIGLVSTVSKRTPDRQHLAIGEHALMVERLDEWVTKLWAMQEGAAEAEARIATLEGALQRIEDGGQGCDPCQCEHDENCCAAVKDYCCPTCIAHLALLASLV